ncbi:MAG: hypothetical protein HY286_05605 [Planctomycetes bacterium]|nr:hypothetical protein [Planctomycetota bacterium]
MNHSAPMLTLAAALLLLSAASSQSGAGAADKPSTAPAWDPELLECVKYVESKRGLKFKTPVPLRVLKGDAFDKAVRAAPENFNFDAVRAFNDLEAFLQESSTGAAARQRLVNDEIAGILAMYNFAEGNILCRAGLRGWMKDNVLSHELTHALEDQYYDIRGMFHGGHRNGRLTCEDFFVIKCVTEGSAQCVATVENRAKAKELLQQLRGGIMIGAEFLGGTSFPLLSSTPTRGIFAGVPSLYTSSAAYVDGKDFFPKDEDGNLLDYPDRANRVLRELPRSTEQILHPEKYWDPKKADAPVIVHIPELKQLTMIPAGFKEVARDVAGELCMGGLLIEFQVEDEWIDRAGSQPASAPSDLKKRAQNPSFFAEGWGGDEFVILKNDAGEQIVIWNTIWDTPDACSRFVESMPIVKGYRRLSKQCDNRAIIVYAKEMTGDAFDRLAKAAGIYGDAHK